MQRHYRILTSSLQLQFALATHCIAAATIFFVLTPALLKWSAIAAVALGAWHGHRQLIQHDIMRLRVDLQRRLIELQRGGQPYFYSKYKVYQTRWFAILKLVDHQTSRVLILNSDSFESAEYYRRLRFDLRQLERRDAA